MLEVGPPNRPQGMVVEKGDTVVLLQVLGVALQAGDHVLNWFALETDLINSREQGEPGE